LARQVDTLVAEFAGHDRPVLIRGGRGLGKERIARRIHALSDRSSARFVAVNAFRDDVPGAVLARAFEQVSDGTLFVNGVGRLDKAGQDLLVEALDGTTFRVIASCGTRIDEKMQAGAFRADLLYALVAHEIVVPPLSQRSEDAVWLAGRMFDILNKRRPAPLRGLSENTLAVIRDHDWPGNGRELRSRLLRAMEVASGEWIHPADVFPELNQEDMGVQSLSEARDAAERRQIIRALERTDGQVTEAARLLKVSRTTLWEKMQKLGL
jgi:DNA-binding NtrC family response regulator